MEKLDDGRLVMTEREYRLNLQLNFRVGHAAEAEESATWLRAESGKAFAAGQDGYARELRTLAGCFDQRAKKHREDQQKLQISLEAHLAGQDEEE